MVIFPIGQRTRPCGDSTVPGGLSAVSFGRDIAARADLGFAMSVTTGSLRALNRIIGSLTVLPAAFTTVPDCVGLPSGQVVSLLQGHGLVPEQLFDHSAVGLPLDVAQQWQSVGTVVPVQTRITLGMLPS
jgi:hypothetical protein